MTENRLVVTMACGERSRKYLEFTGPLMQKYAQKCEADFFCIYQKNDRYSHIGYQKRDYLSLFQSGYDRILHVDADMVIRDSTPDVFNLVPDHAFGAVDELPFQNLNIETPAVDRVKDLRLGGNLVKFYVNVGMFLCNWEDRGILPHEDDKKEYFFKEQSQINSTLYTNPLITTYLLSPEFNFMKLMADAGLDKSKAHIIHYAGNWGGLTDNQVLEMMKKDYAAQK